MHGGSNYAVFSVWFYCRDCRDCRYLIVMLLSYMGHFVVTFHRRVE